MQKEGIMTKASLFLSRGKMLQKQIRVYVLSTKREREQI
jgi:hypothetical protein